MTARRKRSLLAGIEGQLAALNDDASPQHRWRRVERLMGLLRGMCDESDITRLAQLQGHVSTLSKIPDGPNRAWLLLQRLTLARADCVIWQMRVRRQDVEPALPGTTWPPHRWTIPGNDAPFAGRPAVVTG